MYYYHTTFDKPHAYSKKVHFVIVNGVLTVDNKKHIGTRAGHALYSQGTKRIYKSARGLKSFFITDIFFKPFHICLHYFQYHSWLSWAMRLPWQCQQTNRNISSS